MRGQLYGLGRPLAVMALLIALADAALFPVARFTDLLTQDQLTRAIWASAFALGVLFLRVLFDPAAHRAIGKARAELRSCSFRRIPLFDPTWGLFGSRTGGGVLTGLRALLFVELLVALALTGLNPPGPAPFLLPAIGAALCVVLSLTQLKDQYGETNSAPGAEGAS